MPGPEDKEYRLVSPSGEVRTVKGTKALAAFAAQKWRLQTAEEGAAAAAVAGEKERYKPTIEGVTDRVFSGITGGLSDFVRGSLGSEYDREDLAGRKAALGDAGTAIEIGAGALTGLAGAGALGQTAQKLATLSPTGALSRGAGALAERAVVGTGARAAAAKAVNTGAGAFLEGYGQAVGNTLGAYGRDEVDMDAESLIADPLKGGAANTLFAGTLTGAAAAANKGRKLIKGSALTAGKVKPGAVARASDDFSAALGDSLATTEEARKALVTKLEKDVLANQELVEKARALALKRQGKQDATWAKADPLTFSPVDGVPRPVAPVDTVKSTAAPENIAAEATERGGDAAVNAAVDRAAPRARGTSLPASGVPSWKDFVRDRMAPAMRQHGGHGPAMAALGAEYRALKAGTTVAADASSIYVPDPITGVSPFLRAVAELDEETFKKVKLIDDSVAADQPLRARHRVYGKHVRDNAGGKSSGPPLDLTVEELAQETPGRIRAALKNANPAEQMEILQAIGPHKAAQVLRGKFGVFGDENGMLGGEWFAPEFKPLVPKVAGAADAAPVAKSSPFDLTDLSRPGRRLDVAVDDAVPTPLAKGSTGTVRADMPSGMLSRELSPSQVPEEVFDDPWARSMGLSAAEADDIAHSAHMFDTIGAHEDAGAAVARALGPDAPEGAQRLALARDLATDDQSRRAMRRMAQVAEESAIPRFLPDDMTVPGRAPSWEDLHGPLVGVSNSPLKRRLREAGFPEPTPLEDMTGLDLKATYANEAAFKKAMEGFDIRGTGAGRPGAHPDTLGDFTPPNRAAEVMDAAVPPGRQARGSLADRMRGQGFETSFPGRPRVPFAEPPPRLPPVSGELGGSAAAQGTVDAGGVGLDPSLASRSGYSAADIRADRAAAPRIAQRGRLAEAFGGAADAARARGGAETASQAAPGKRGLLSTLADAGAVVEGLQALGVSTGFDPDKIPLIGPVLGPYLKFRGLLMATGKLTGRVPANGQTLARARAVKVRNGMYKAVDKLLAGTSKAAKVAGMVGASQAWRLKDVLDKPINPEATETAKRKSLATEREALMERAEEARALAGNPEAVARAVRLRFPDDADPDLVDAAVAVEQRKSEYLAKHAPAPPPPSLFGRRLWEPSPGETVKYARRLRAAQDPSTVYADIASGNLSAEAAEAFREVYPRLYVATRSYLVEQQAELNANLSPDQVANLSVLFRVPLRPSLDPETMQRLQEAGGAAPVAPGPPGIGQQPPMNPPPGSAPDLASAAAQPVYRGPGQ